MEWSTVNGFPRFLYLYHSAAKFIFRYLIPDPELGVTISMQDGKVAWDEANLKAGGVQFRKSGWILPQDTLLPGGHAVNRVDRGEGDGTGVATF